MKSLLEINPQKLKIAMANSCMSSSDLCKAANIQSATLQRILKGSKAKPDTIGKIAKALGIRVEELI